MYFLCGMLFLVFMWNVVCSSQFQCLAYFSQNLILQFSNFGKRKTLLNVKILNNQENWCFSAHGSQFCLIIIINHHLWKPTFSKRKSFQEKVVPRSYDTNNVWLLPLSRYKSAQVQRNEKYNSFKLFSLSILTSVASLILAIFKKMSRWQARQFFLELESWSIHHSSCTNAPCMQKSVEQRCNKTFPQYQFECRILVMTSKNKSCKSDDDLCNLLAFQVSLFFWRL